MRPDLEQIVNWVKPHSNVLDLGCGAGELLVTLQKKLQCTAYGVEIDHASIQACIKQHVSVIQADLNHGLKHFDNASFDTVIMSQSLQAMNYPDKIILEMLRVGQEAIISFPNMGHISARWQLLLGKMPITEFIPHTWYNTPNIHLCTLRDFENLCSTLNVKIIENVVVGHNQRSTPLIQWLPNLFAQTAIYRITKK